MKLLSSRLENAWIQAFSIRLVFFVLVRVVAPFLLLSCASTPTHLSLKKFVETDVAGLYAFHGIAVHEGITSDNWLSIYFAECRNTSFVCTPITEQLSLPSRSSGSLGDDKLSIKWSYHGSHLERWLHLTPYLDLWLQAVTNTLSTMQRHETQVCAEILIVDDPVEADLRWQQKAGDCVPFYFVWTINVDAYPTQRGELPTQHHNAKLILDSMRGAAQSFTHELVHIAQYSTHNGQSLRHNEAEAELGGLCANILFAFDYVAHLGGSVDDIEPPNTRKDFLHSIKNAAKYHDLHGLDGQVHGYFDAEHKLAIALNEMKTKTQPANWQKAIQLICKEQAVYWRTQATSG